MASIRMEFHEHEKEKMWKLYELLTKLFNPRKPKPPEKTELGKWQCYIESRDHKKVTKELRKQREQGM